MDTRVRNATVLIQRAWRSRIQVKNRKQFKKIREAVAKT
jgi:hypothetical protein